MTTTKAKFSIAWIEIAKFAGAIVIGLGGGFGYTQVGATQSQSAPPSSDESTTKLELHQATDSVRWVYTERRLERIEKTTAESHDILLRIESRTSP